jgi:hypothetical protein
VKIQAGLGVTVGVCGGNCPVDVRRETAQPTGESRTDDEDVRGMLDFLCDLVADALRVAPRVGYQQEVGGLG